MSGPDSGNRSGNHSRISARRVFWGLGIVFALGGVSWVALRFTGEEGSRRSPYRIGQVSDFLLELGAGPRGIDSIQVPEGFEVEVAAGPDLVSYGVFFTFDDRGRLFLCESAGKNTSDQEALDQPSFRIRLLEDEDGDGVFDSAKTFADKITMALGALVSYRPGLTTPGFQFLLGLLPVETEADLRLSVAQVLSRAGLTSEQLLVVAREHLPGADPLILPTLLDAFRNAREEEVGRALVAGLLKTPEAVGGMAGERLRELLENFPSGVRREARPLLIQVEKEKESRAERLKELEPLLTAGSDVGRGRNVFFGKKGACSSCHTIGIEGGHVGPDLTAVGSVRSGIDILEAIVFPSASFVPGHEVYRVKTARETFSGVRGESAGDAVVLISGPRDRVRIPRSEIVSMEPSTVSLMPDGFDENLTEQEMIDMLAFLQAQKSRRIAAGSAS